MHSSENLQLRILKAKYAKLASVLLLDDYVSIYLYFSTIGLTIMTK